MTTANFYGTSVCEQTCQIIDVSIPEDGRVREKEDENVQVKSTKTQRETFEKCGV